MATIIKGTRLGNKLDGTSGADEIYGYEGNDQLNGGLGNDLLDGGTGTDVLQGGAGSDVYVFAAGSGRDTIRETINGTDIDVIRFADLRPSHVKRVERDGSDLIILMATGDEIRIAGHYAGYSIEQVQFSDGTVWYGPDLNKVMRTFNGTTGNDFIIGSSGIDLLDGKAGDDVLQGGTGGDTYIFASGSGRDTIAETLNAGETDIIRFTTAIPEQVSLLRKGADLLISVSSGEEVRVAGQFAGYGIEKIEFSNGIAWGAKEINSAPNEIIGSASGDYLVGTLGTDLIHGAGGDDMLRGAEGSDTYFFAPGSGRDTIGETINGTDVDTIRFSSGIAPEQVGLLRQGMDLLIRLSSGDEVRVLGQYAGTGVERIEFENGTTWSAAEINNAIQEILGSSGADFLIGSAGTDLIHGMGGDDMLQGGEGSDTYFFNPGDGRDTVREAFNAGEVDTLRFTSFVAPENVSMLRQGADLLIRVSSGDEVRVAGQFAGNGIEKIEFGNGAVWGLDEINAVPNEIFGTESGDYLIGTAGTDLIHGMGGDDMLRGGEGSDTYFYPSGKDTIVEAPNAGETDTLRLEPGMTPDTIMALRRGDDLLLQTWYGAEVRVAGQFAGAGVEKIEFGNGVVWSLNEINAVPNEIFGTESADYLIGTAGTDLIHGMGGDDMLRGGEGSDTYFYPSGKDTIIEAPNAGETDTLRLDSGMTPDTITALRQGYDLLLQTWYGVEVRVAGQYAGAGIEKIEFGNGVVWGATEINNVPDPFAIQPVGVSTVPVTEYPLAG